MTRDQALTLLQHLEVQGVDAHRRQGWIVAFCPFGPTRHQSGQSNNRTFGVQVKTSGLSRFHCFACGSSGGMVELVLGLKHDKLVEDLDGFRQAVKLAQAEELEQVLDIPGYEAVYAKPSADAGVVEFPEMWLASFQRASKVPRAMKYLNGRGVSPALADVLDLRYDSGRQLVCFPIRSFDGALAGLHGRDITGQWKPRYYAYRSGNGEWSRSVWYGEAWVDPDKTVVMVESVFDLASVYRVYRNVMCPLSSGISVEKLKRVSMLTDRILIADKGTGGNVFTKQLSGGGVACRTLELPESVKDPGEATFEQVSELLDPFVKLDPPIK